MNKLKMQSINFGNIYLIAILIISIILRFLFLDKPSGLWYDEIVSFKQASQANILSVIIYTIKTDIHMPLYQVFLHLWGNIFSFSDFSLRAFSAACGVLSVLGAYLTGREIKDVKTGLIASFFIAINSFFIYYSQEVRMYSFLMLFSFINLYYYLKINKSPQRNDIIGFIISSCALIYTQTIAIIFIGFEFLVLFILNKEYVRSYIKMFLFTLLISLPIIILFISNPDKYIHEINGYYCDWSSLFVVLQNFLSPIQTGINGNQIHYMHSLFVNLNIINAVFICCPVIIGLYFMFIALKENPRAKIIFIPAIGFIVAEIIAFKFTNFKIMTRYMALIAPVIIIMTGLGASYINKRAVRNILITIFVLIQISYLSFSDNAAYKLQRNGFKPLAQIIKTASIHDKDIIIVWNRKEILDKYINENVTVLSILKDFAYQSEVIQTNSKNLDKMSLEERKEVLKKYFTDNVIPQNTLYLFDFLDNYMQNGQKLIITTSTYYDQFSPEYMNSLQKNTTEYKNLAYNDLLTAKSLIDVKYLSSEKFRYIKRAQNGNFVIYIFEK